MKHSRSQAFAAALHDTLASGHWSTLAADPSDPRVLASRASVLRAAWRPDIPDRIEYLEQRCTGANVLDLGCVAHDLARMASPTWLHARLARVASQCVGVDIHHEGIVEMQRLGFHAREYDLSDGPGPLGELAPFDVIVAGELIEHVEAMDMLFRSAEALLADDGQLIITTPNPWAPHRVRAAQLGYVWENADHILLAFPSGVAELAERHGLQLAEAATTSIRQRSDCLIDRIKAAKRRLMGRHWKNVGYSTLGQRRMVHIGYGERVTRRVLQLMRLSRRRFLGETFVYVVSRPRR